jgi:hypothetical protein
MPTPRVNPDRVLTAAERQARRRELLLQRLATAVVVLHRIAEAETLSVARWHATEGLRLLEEPR